MTDQLPDIAVPAPPVPKAAADQLTIAAFEGGLLELARTHHPNVSWWHGYRRVEDTFGSWCYICERFIVTWGGNYGPSAQNRTQIHTHKLLHRNGVVPGAESNTTEGTPQ